MGVNVNLPRCFMAMCVASGCRDVHCKMKMPKLAKAIAGKIEGKEDHRTTWRKEINEHA